MDTIPEIMDGKNVADFIDPDIAEKLEALEREEERLQAEGFYENDEIIVSLLNSLYPALDLNTLLAA
jgi:nucleolar GTP-binding protein